MIGKLLKVAATATLVATAVHAYREGQTHGTYHCIPFDFRFPTVDRVRERLWNPDDPRVITPTIFGAGWSVNLYQAGRQMGLIQDQENDGTPV